MKSRLLGAVCASIITLATSISAAPITLDFTGVITSNYDYTSTSHVPYGVGTSFSGYATYDVANAEGTESHQTNPGNNSASAYSVSGCYLYTNGVCTNDRGGGAPVVTDYHFEWIGGVVSPWMYSLEFSDGSRRFNNFDVPPAPVPQEAWSLLRNQFLIAVVGDTNATETTTQRQFLLSAFSPDAAFMTGPIDDLAQSFDTGIFSSTGTGRITLSDFVSVKTCVAANNCTTAYNAGSYQLRGDITSVSFRSSVIPIPSALYLFGSGLIGLVGVARRKAA